MGTNEYRFIETTAGEADEREKKLREVAFKKFQVVRLSVAAGDGWAAAKLADSMRALFADSGALEDLVRTALTVNYESTGRAFFDAVQGVMLADAGIAAARELGMLNTPAPLEVRRVAALESIGVAIEQLGM
jgi:hypothetical protein